MQISFDLDSTLIPSGNEFPTEKCNFIARLLKIEKIRKGTITIIAELQNKGHIIHIYTTSYRSKPKIRFMLFYYGLFVNRIITQYDNDRVLKPQNIYFTKFPPAFGINLHIDDSYGVAIEGEKSGFKTLIIDPQDNDWTQKVINHVRSLE